jgi:hypothetical protein
MNIDNARALKASLLTTTVKSLKAPTAVRALGIRAQAASAAKDPIRTVALGISRPASNTHSPRRHSHTGCAATSGALTVRPMIGRAIC